MAAQLARLYHTYNMYTYVPKLKTMIMTLIHKFINCMTVTEEYLMCVLSYSAPGEDHLLSIRGGSLL